MIYTTYSLEDDKLRLHFTERIHEDTWEKFKVAGFQWAPSQDLLYAVWSPDRERLCLSISDEPTLFDEESTRAERAEDKAERFEKYSKLATERSNDADKRASKLAEMVGGQPILIGHHSEKRARKDQERIWNDMHKSVEEWKKSTYWASRAEASIKHAERMERPDVRFRRIKKLKAELRNHQHRMNYYSERGNIERAEYGYRNKQPAIAITFDEYLANLDKCNRVHNQAWIDHLEVRIAYEQALYDATPTEADKVGKPLEKGGQVLIAGHIARTPTWFKILRVNKGRDGTVNSVTIPSNVPWRTDWKVSVEDIKDIRTREEALEAENE
jgi:hypothetical protein